MNRDEELVARGMGWEGDGIDYGMLKTVTGEEDLWAVRKGRASDIRCYRES